MNNPKTSVTQGTQDYEKPKHKHNTICFRHALCASKHKKAYKTRTLIQTTGGKDEEYIVQYIMWVRMYH